MFVTLELRIEQRIFHRGHVKSEKRKFGFFEDSNFNIGHFQREIAISIVKLDFAKVREQFMFEDAIDSCSGVIFKLYLSNGPSPPFLSVKSSTTLILLISRLLTVQPVRLILPLVDFGFYGVDI